MAVLDNEEDFRGRLRPTELAALGIEGLDPLAQHLLCWMERLADCGDLTVRGWSSERLAERTGMSVGQFKRARAVLENAGVVEVIGTRGGRGVTNTYQLVLPTQLPCGKRRLSTLGQERRRSA